MAGYLSSASLKMKRKDLDDVYDDFSDFSLVSPARKIRRLDAELPPVMEEVEMQPVFDRFVPEMQVPAEELASAPANDVRAIVLYKQVNSPIVQSPSCFSLTLDSDILSGYKKQFLHQTESLGIEARSNNNGNGESNQCMAVIPWVPSQFTLPPTSATETLDLMEAEESGAATMDIEDDNVGMVQSGALGNEGVQPWQQQHCMTPQLSPNAPTPIVWYR